MAPVERDPQTRPGQHAQETPAKKKRTKSPERIQREKSGRGMIRHHPKVVVVQEGSGFAFLMGRTRSLKTQRGEACENGNAIRDTKSRNSTFISGDKASHGERLTNLSNTKLEGGSKERGTIL